MSIISRIRAPHASLSRYPPAAPLLLDGAHDPRPHGLAPFPDGEAELLLEPDGLDELDFEADVVPRHDHLDSRGQAHHPGDVRRPEVELGPVAGEERGVPAPLLLREDVALRLEDGVGGDGGGLGDDLPPLHLLPLRPPEQEADVVSRLALVQRLPEHLDPGDDRLLVLPQPHDLDLLPYLDHPALDPAGDHRPPAP